MTSFYVLIVVLGLAPFMLGTFFLKPSSGSILFFRHIGSVLLCALAFNLTFFWQELWLVIPKAMTPGLQSTLFHNNHDWTGDLPIAELLQGTGAIATMASGIIFGIGLSFMRRSSVTWRLFFFWMTFQGLYQALTQLAIGTLLSGNDVGRALTYLDVSQSGKILLLSLAVILMALSGIWLARLYSLGTNWNTEKYTRNFAYIMIMITMVSILIIVPFRIPRNIIEVALIPFFVNFVGLGWLVIGGAFSNSSGFENQRASITGPAIALIITLLFFQFVLRPGVTF